MPLEPSEAFTKQRVSTRARVRTGATCIKLLFNLFCVAAFSVSGALAQDATTVRLVETTPTHRVIEHALGTTEVPRELERVVSLSFFATDILAALGQPPVASETYLQDFAYLEPHLGGVTPIPSGEAGYNLEAVVAARPDLILIEGGEGQVYGADYGQLSRIAPTVVLEIHPEHYRRFWPLDLGLILGLEAETEARLAEYENKLEAAQARLAEADFSDTVMLVGVWRGGFGIYGGEGYTAVLYKYGLELSPPALVRELALDKYLEQISLEAVPQLEDAEHIFVSVDGDADETFGELEGSALWRGLPAFQAGNVYPVERRSWMTSGLLADEGKVSDVLNALLGE